MRVKLMTFRYSATLGGFDDEALSAFIRDKEVIAFREHFYEVNQVPHVTCVLAYQDAVVPRAMLEEAREVVTNARANNGAFQSQRRRDDRPDPTAGLSEGDRVLFNTLREWRAKQAHSEGVPPYLLFTNRQLLAIVAAKPESATALGHIEGVGKAKLERYARAVLELVHGKREVAALQVDTAAPAPPTESGAPSQLAEVPA